VEAHVLLIIAAKQIELIADVQLELVVSRGTSILGHMLIGGVV
jgi:hypothetical protein